MEGKGGMASYNSPCAACKFLRRKCNMACIFAPYFPPEEPQKFANVHKIFGASNVTKLLNELLPNQREDAVSSLAYEAEARMRDPVYGCVGAISYLQRQVERLQKELDAANAELIRFVCNDSLPPLPTLISPSPRPLHNLIISDNNNTNQGIGGVSSGIVNATFYQTPSTTFATIPLATSYPIPWNSHSFDKDSSGSNVTQGGVRAAGGGEGPYNSS